MATPFLILALALVLNQFGFAADSKISLSDPPSGTFFKTFEGVDFLLYEGRFSGEACWADSQCGSFAVGCSFIVPADPNDWNAALLVEPLHFRGWEFFAGDRRMGEVVRRAVSGESLLFGSRASFDGNTRFGYASVGWENGYPEDVIDGPKELGHAIVAEFARVLRRTPLKLLAGKPIEQLNLAGISQTARTLQQTLLLTAGEHLADNWFIVGFAAAASCENACDGTWDKTQCNFDYADEAVFILLDETAALLGKEPCGKSIGAATQRKDSRTRQLSNENVHWYEFPGAQHLPPHGRAELADRRGESVDGLNPLDWTAFWRAIFVAATNPSVVPPANGFIYDCPGSQPPWSSKVDEICRDDLFNALGDIRHPDLVAGLGTFQPLPWPYAEFIDHSCDFKTQSSYLSPFQRQVDILVRDGYLLKDEAKDLIAEAEASGVGKKGRCN